MQRYLIFINSIVKIKLKSILTLPPRATEKNPSLTYYLECRCICNCKETLGFLHVTFKPLSYTLYTCNCIKKLCDGSCVTLVY